MRPVVLDAHRRGASGLPRRSRCPVSIAMSEKVRDRPRRSVLGGCQAAKASGVTHTVKLPRCWSALSYSGQLVTL